MRPAGVARFGFRHFETLVRTGPARNGTVPLIRDRVRPATLRAVTRSGDCGTYRGISSRFPVSPGGTCRGQCTGNIFKYRRADAYADEGDWACVLRSVR